MPQRCHEPSFSPNGTLLEYRPDSGSAEGPDDVAPLLGFVGDQLSKLSRRSRQRHAEVSETDLHLGVGEGGVDLLVELLDDLGWRVPGNADAIPRCGLVILP